MALHIVDHPVLAETLARLRDRTTPCHDFRVLAHRAGLLLASEATRTLPTTAATVESPLGTAEVRRVSARVVAVPVLRAGIGMLGAFLDLVPSAQVGYFGLERDETTAVVRRYYEKIPTDLADAYVFLLDPMLATGGSAVMAVDGLKGMGARRVCLVSVVAAPEGVARLQASAPDVEIYTAALDRALDERKYIVPGLGDFGDRLYGT